MATTEYRLLNATPRGKFYLKERGLPFFAKSPSEHSAVTIASSRSMSIPEASVFQDKNAETNFVQKLISLSMVFKIFI